MSAGLTIAQLNEVRLAQLPRVNKGYKDSQKFNRYTGQKYFLKHKKEVPLGQDGKITWKWRYKAAAGPQVNNPYRATAATYDEYGAEAFLYYNQHVDKNFVYDTIELKANKSSPERIYNILQMRRSAQREGIANWLEAQLMTNIPANSSDRDIYNSIRTILRRSMTSAGVFVASPDGGFNGVYQTWGDGTTTATYAGVDLSTLAAERFRNYVATHDGVVNQSFCDRIKKAQDECTWEPLNDLEGKFEVADMYTLFMDPDLNQDYQNFVSLGGDDRKGDVYPMRSYSLNGAKITPCPQLRLDLAKPVYGVNGTELQMETIEGCWDNFAELSADGKKMAAEPMRFENSHTSFYEPIDFFGQLKAEMPRHAGFIVHGSF